MVIGNASGLGEAVHALADFNEDVAIVLEGVELVEIHDGIGDDASGNAHVFKALHRCVEVKVLEIPGHEASIGGGDDTVEEAFDSGEVGGFRGYSTRVVNTVTPAGESNTSWVVFFRRPVHSKTRRVARTAWASVIGSFPSAAKSWQFRMRVQMSSMGSSGFQSVSIFFSLVRRLSGVITP